MTATSDWAAKFMEKYSAMEEFNKISPDIEKFIGSGGSSLTSSNKKTKTKEELMQIARKINLPNRSKMNKAELLKNLKAHPSLKSL